MGKAYKTPDPPPLQLIRTGEVVIVHEGNKPRRLAIVEDLIKGNDG